jgi:hypothetical protein
MRKIIPFIASGALALTLAAAARVKPRRADYRQAARAFARETLMGKKAKERECVPE